MARGDGDGPRWIEMPSISDVPNFDLEPGQNYHDLGERYPDAPVPRGIRDAIVHRAVLDDITGISKVMDWVSDGDLVIVEMSNLLIRELELQTAVERIRDFVEDDISGEVVRLGNTRLLLLPNDFESVKGPERGPSAYY
ncbi:MAG: hypothetical protein ACJ0HH_00435 [Candidatus Thalassarchaeum sp.]